MAFKVQDLMVRLSPETRARTVVWAQDCGDPPLTDHPSGCEPNSCNDKDKDKDKDNDRDKDCYPAGALHLAALRQQLRQTLEAR